MILAVDPGTDISAIVELDGDRVADARHLDNEQMRRHISDRAFALDACRASLEHVLVVEMIASYGMPVGREVFESVFWTGRFCEAWGAGFERIYRRDVKLHLCQSARAKDANVRQALIDRYGGTRAKAIGTRKQQGPLYGIAKHLWAALAVGVTYYDQQQRRRADRERTHK